jgi:hypothetical protein
MPCNVYACKLGAFVIFGGVSLLIVAQTAQTRRVCLHRQASNTALCCYCIVFAANKSLSLFLYVVLTDFTNGGTGCGCMVTACSYQRILQASIDISVRIHGQH